MTKAWNPGACRGLPMGSVLALMMGCGGEGPAEARAFEVDPRDPYANAVGPGSSAVAHEAFQAVGPPDGESAIMLGLLGTSLVLDMGEGEEGTGELSVYSSGVSIGVVTSVDFLGADGTLLSSSLLHLAKIRGGKQVTHVPYPSAPTPYRYVRIRGLLAVPYAIDAVEAATIVAPPSAL
ncbi:hypothetical protein [Stigmatella erecta]|uniref:Uncharacterized protein n=1 Tax=Stigmatella erecta TaxID=83460 RepID=A0A1I0L3S7_9BACT|nr:hypothetical protein [Stigmatella erecta]SEU34111.1 hypothetical protein SAMN05443639_118132 [Stigmatella erecta]